MAKVGEVSKGRRRAGKGARGTDVELVVVGWLDGAIGRESADDLDSLLELRLGHVDWMRVLLRGEGRAG